MHQLTPTQKDAFYGVFKHNDPRRKPDGSLARTMGGAYHRMMEVLRDKGMWYSYSRGEDKRGKHRDINTNAPSAAGLRAWLAQDTRSLAWGSHIEERIKNLEMLEAAWNKAEQERKDIDRRATEERVARQRTERIARVRKVMADHNLAGMFDMDDAGLLEFTDTLVHASEFA